MRAEVLLALNRSVAGCCEGGAPSLQHLLASMAQELALVVAPDIVGVAVVATPCTGRPSVGQARHGVCLSDEALLSLAEKCRSRGRSLVVKDHTLEPLTYSATAPLASVVVQLTGSLVKQQPHLVQLWFGCEAAVTARLVEKLQRISAAVTEWMESSAYSIELLLETGDARRQFEAYQRDAISCAHDIRAAIGAIKYRQSLSDGGEGSDACESRADLSYIESLLARFGASSHVAEVAQTKELCQVFEVVERVVERCKLVAKRSCLTFRVLPSEHEAVTLLDPIELERALTNIIGNAVKHSRGNEVVIQTTQLRGLVKLSIRDNGRGFPAHVLNALRSSASQVRSSGDGWGVGLLSTKRRVEAAGGGVEVSSIAGGGSEVLLTLPSLSYPLPQASPPLEVREGARYGSDRTQRGDVWLVDDDAEHSAALGRALSRYGISTRSFSELSEVIKELGRSDVSSIVCDVTMPDGGAEQLLVQLRSAHSLLPVAIMSGESDDARLYRLAGAGARAFFSKPVEIEPLVEWILSCSRDSQRAAS
jgi:signal transduction histidine kinase/CheY-like chemotaxis protein